MAIPPKIEIIDTEPEEEIVHIIHKPRKNKPMKEQIVYMNEEDDDDDNEISEFSPRYIRKQNQKNIVYVSHSPSPYPVKVIPDSIEPNQKIIYAIPKPQKKQVIYVKEAETPVKYIYKDIDEDHRPYDYSFSRKNERQKVPNYIYYESPRVEKKIIYTDE